MNERRFSVTTLSHEDKVAFGEKHVDALVSLLEKSLKSFFPNANYVTQVENRGFEDLQVVIVNSGYSIDLSETTVKSIAKHREVAAWQLTGYKHHPSSRSHPEEFEDVPMDVFHGHYQVAEALIKAIFSDEVNGWFTGEGEAEQYEAEREMWDAK